VLDVWGADLVEKGLAVAAGVLLLGLFTHVGDEFGGTLGGVVWLGWVGLGRWQCGGGDGGEDLRLLEDKL
jgi:hypothetical protein